MNEKLECGCRIENFAYKKMCAKHQRETDEIRARWAADKKTLDEWNIGPPANHSRRGTFEKLGGPITWDEKFNANARDTDIAIAPLANESADSYPTPKLVEGGDLTSLFGD